MNPMAEHAVSRWWRASRLGDRVLTVAAVLLAGLYTFLAFEGPSAATLTQAVVSWCFVPFVWVWRSRPVVSAAGFTACLAAWAVTWIAALPSNLGISPWLITAPMAVYATARYCTDRRIPRAFLTVMFLGTFLSPVMWRLLDTLELRYVVGLDSTYLIASHWLLLLAVYFAGTRAHGRVLQQRAEEDARLSQLRTAQEEERLLIARELHDVLAHSLTLMKVQANAGLVAAARDGDAAVAALRDIRDTSDTALAEVRGIVAALRSDSPASLEPSHRVSDLPGLLDGFRAAGVRIHAALPEEVPDMSSLTQLAITRIIIESLTNVLRHQGPNARAEVAVRCSETVDIVVTSTGTEPGTGHSGAGAGLIGLEERARSLGGTFSAGGTSEHFEVRASIPLRGGQ